MVLIRVFQKFDNALTMPCRSWTASGRQLTPAAAEAAVKLCLVPAACSLLLQSLREARDASTCNALLLACSNASSVPLAVHLLQLMGDSCLDLRLGATFPALLAAIQV